MGLNYMGPLICRFFQQIKHSTINVFSLPYQFFNNICFSLPYFIVRIQYIIHVTYNICVTGKASRQQQAIGLGGVKSYTWIFDCSGGVRTPNPHIFQGSTVVANISNALVCFVHVVWNTLFS